MFAHVLSDPGTTGVWFALAATAFVLLTAHHLRVKHDRLGRAQGRPIAGLVVVLAVSAAVMPTVGAGQARSGLPDLISDPPNPAFLKQLRGDDGEPMLVFTFDGYVHNIGTGPLDVVGNPQVPGGMVQRVREDGEWREVGTPTVRYETDDGHNHFHLIEAVDYVLWNESQGSQTAAGSKIGFCLVDSEQMEPGTDQAYSEELDNFCQENNPSATSLRMGISSGWRDIYDATTTLQWVDVSYIAPGRYWLGAITDPNDEIVESNEDNNDLIYSDRPAIVPGWLPSDVVASTDGETVEIVLPAEAFGTVAAPTFTIEQGPLNGRLDVPVGARLSDPIVRYTPDPGHAGEDSFTFSVHDSASIFPLESPTATVSIQASGGGEELVASPFPPGLTLDTSLVEVGVGEALEFPVEVAYITGDPVALYAIGLPPGLRVVDDAIVGVAPMAGVWNVELVALAIDGATVSREVTFVVNEAVESSLDAGVDRSSPLMQALQVTLGPPSLTSTFEATGLPPGLVLDETAPVVSGRPTEVGEFSVEVVQTDADGTRHEATFSWTVRPAVAIDFAL